MNDDAIPDETTILKFRRLLEQHGLAQQLLDAVNAHLGEKPLLLRQGIIVDATIIHAPSSTKNQDKARDPQMHQTKKGNQYYFGMKAHIGVDADSGLVHTVVTTAANVAEVTQVAYLLHGKETRAHADAGYVGTPRRVVCKKLTWHIAVKRGAIKAMTPSSCSSAPRQRRLTPTRSHMGRLL